MTWLAGMQGRDGGWASFDVDNNKSIFNYIPFADHNAMLDPSTSDITARVLESYSFYGIAGTSPGCRRAIDFLRRGARDQRLVVWPMGVNYVYGTWQVIRGLYRIGVDPSEPMIQKAADWLMSVQNADGGWGESCISYEGPKVKGQAESTPSQTAWALMGLMCAGKADSPAVSGRHQITSSTSRKIMAPGMRSSSPARAFQGYSI